MVLSKTINLWRNDLGKLLRYYERTKIQLNTPFLYLFLFFIFLNIGSYWFAMLTAFPNLVFGKTFAYYFKVQFPVGFLGALFDSLSFFITINIIRRALRNKGNVAYTAHLSIDILIAILATFWVLFVFSFSGWIISLVTLEPESLIERSLVYEQRFVSALQNPSGKNELKNIYFGLMMGCSAILPTTIHVYLFLKYFVKSFKKHSFIKILAFTNGCRYLEIREIFHG